MNKKEYGELLISLEEGPTPSIDVYREALEFDSNFPYRIAVGHLVNFLEGALDRLDHSIVLKDPPPDQRRPPRPKRELELDSVAEKLRSMPGEWSLVEHRTWASNAAKYQHRGLETRVRKAADNKWDVYARAPKEEEAEE